jgi:putative transposase
MLRGLLAAEGCKIGGRHVRTLMRRMGIEALYRRPRTTTPEPGHKIHPYLLRALRSRDTMDVSFCIAALEDALARHDTPEIFNTDQGSQFISAAFTSVLADRGITISMDGKGA